MWNINDLEEFNARIFSEWRKANDERNVQVREVLEDNFENLPVKSAFYREGTDFMPKLSDFGFTEDQIQNSSLHKDLAAYNFLGGESEGLNRLNEYVNSGSILTYKKDRNGFVGQDFSSKLSPWLANGCLSIRKVYHMVRA